MRPILIIISSGATGAIIAWLLAQPFGYCQHAGGTIQAKEVAIAGGLFHARSKSKSRVLLGGLFDFPSSGGLVEFDIENGRIATVIKGHSGLVHSIDVTEDGKMAASGGWNGEVILWKTSPVSLVRKLNIGISNRSSSVLCVKFSPNGKYLAASGDKVVKIWTIPGDAAKEIPELRNNGICQMAFTQDSRNLWIADFDRIVIVDVTKVAAKHSWTFRNLRITSMSLSLHGDLAFVANDNGENIVYDANDRKSILSFPLASTERIIVSTFSPKGDVIYCGGNCGTIYGVEVASRKLVSFVGHKDRPIRSIEVLGDESLITCGDDHVLRIWNCKKILEKLASQRAK